MNNEWSVIKVNSNNGFRLGINLTEDNDPNYEILATNLNESEASNLCTKLSNELNIKEFDNDIDILI